jgi:RHS repeat-associated protein
MEHQYWYHSDHLGSAQLTTSRSGELHERIEYTPYGEIWVEHRYDLAEGSLPYRFTGKELDEETGYYYYGARYLDPRTSRWISTDPAVGDYVPSAPVDDEAKKRNGKLPGMGGVFNLVNLHVYHYAGNNPVKYTDPDGEEIKVQIHRAFGFTSYYHASIKITLDSTELIEAFQEEKHFVDNKIPGNKGDQYITIGGTASKGLLIGKINRNSDKNDKNKKGSYLITGIDEVKAVKGILKAYDDYKEGSKLDYDLFPEKGDGYNSNSYISGILEKTGLPRQDFYKEKSHSGKNSQTSEPDKMKMPGWDKPIPITTKE